MNLYLHIGMNKAGSSSIQEAFLQLQAPLLDLGYYYPDAISLDSGSANTRINEDIKNRTSLFLDDVEVARSKRCDLILSSEHVFSHMGSFSDDDLEVLSRTLLDHGINLHVILVARNQYSRLLSVYKQDVINTTSVTQKCANFLGEDKASSLAKGVMTIMRFHSLPATRSALILKMQTGWLEQFFRSLDSRIPFSQVKYEAVNPGITDVYTEIIRQFNRKSPTVSENIHFKHLIMAACHTGNVVLARQARRFNKHHKVLQETDLEVLQYEANAPLEYTREEFENAVGKLKLLLMEQNQGLD